MGINADGNFHFNLAEQNRAYTMKAVVRVAFWVESTLNFPGEPPSQTIDLEELFEGKLPQPATMPKLERDEGSNLALQRLISLFELSDTEVLILLATVATELIGSFGQMCAAYNGSIERSTPTFAMISSLFARSNNNFDYRATSSQSNLNRWQLIQINELNRYALFQSPLTVDPSILNYLLGNSYHDRSIYGLVNQIPAWKLDSSPGGITHTEVAERIATQISRAIAEQYPAIFQLTGTDVTNKDRLAEAVASSVGCGLIELNYLNVPTDNEQLWMLATRLKRWQRIDGSLPYIKAERLRKDDHNRSEALTRLIELLKIPALVGIEEPTNWGEVNTINTEVRVPDEIDQLALWHKYLNRVTPELERDLPKLVSQFNLTAPTIKAIATQLYLDSSSNHLSAFERLWELCRSGARQKLDSLATRVSSDVSWQDLILPDSTKAQLAHIVSQVGYKWLVYREWGFTSNRGLGITALFGGTSGTGKTTAAEAIANDLKLDLYKIDLSTLISKYIGETEKNLRRIFDAAEAGGAILLFDEADALFGKRTEVKDSKDRHSNAEISYLLQKMEAYRGLAILTTNIEEAIDSAFKRRLRFIVKFVFPDVAARENIWRSVFSNAAPTRGLNYEMLATMELSGGNIRSIALNAAFRAAEDNEPIQMKHIVSAAKSEAQKLGSDTYQLEMMVAQLNMSQSQDNSLYNSSTSSFNNNDSYQLEPSNNPIGGNHPTNVPQPELSAKNHCWSPKDTLKQARSFFERGDYLKGYAIFTEGVTIYPNHSGLNFWMGFAAWEVRLNVPPTEIIAALDRAENGNGQWFDIEEGKAACWFLKARVMERFKLEGAKRCYDLYVKYIEAYPKGHHVETAKTRRNELTFEAKFGKPPEE